MSRKSNLQVPPSWSNQDRMFGDSLKENLDILLGHRGDPLNAAVTFNDLIDSGIIELRSGVNTFGGSIGNLVPVRQDNFPDLAIPPAPTSLAANGAFQSILLTWNLAQYKGHSHVEVWRHTSDSISDATLIGQTSGFTGVFSDNVGGNQTFYYWVRAINNNGELGPFNSSTGTQGQTAADVSFMLSLLTDSITSSQLVSALSTPIAAVSTLQGTVGSLETYTGYVSSYSGDNLLTRIGSTDSAITTINGSITSINSSLSSLSTNVSNLQTSVTDLTANVGTVYVQTSAPTGTIATNSRWYDSDDNMKAYFYSGSAWVSLEDPRIAANQTSITNLDAQVFNSDGSARLATGASLSALDTTVTNINGTLTTVSSDVTSLKGVVFDSSGNSQIATTTALNNLTSQVTSNDGDISTLNTEVTQLESQVFNSDGSARLATGAAVTSLTDTVNTQGNSISSIQTDITALEGAVFDNSGALKLATTVALTGLTNTVEAIYDGSNASVVKTIQTDVTDLESQVFNSDGTARLATGAALTGLTNTVTAIYDGTNPSTVKTIQTDVTSLNAQVFDGNGNARLATTSALAGLTNSVEAIYDGTNPSVIKTIQGDVTALETEVFLNGTSRLATASALSSLTTSVEAIYDGTNPSVVKSISEDVTSLNNAMFDASNNVKLADAGAVSLLQTEVWGDGVTPGGAVSSRIDSLDTMINHPDTGFTSISTVVNLLKTETFPDGTTSASAIDNLKSEIRDENGALRFATAAALSELQTEVFADGTASASRIDSLFTEVFTADGDSNLASAEAFRDVDLKVFPTGHTQTSSIDSLASEVFINGEIGGGSRLATVNALNTIQTEVFPSGVTEASRLSQLSSAIWTDGDPSKAAIVASADALQVIQTEVFPSGTASASKIDTLQVTVEGADGAGGIKNSIEVAQNAIGDSTQGLSSQYSVKLDTNGYVSGFGLSNTSNGATPTSAFVVTADKFAIVNPLIAGNATNTPANNENSVVPFTVVASSETVNGQVVPRGVYMDGAFIKNGTITSATIGQATIDNVHITASLDASKIVTGQLDTSLINLDGSTITSVDGTIQIASLAVDTVHINNLAVDTIKVADNAITVPISAFTSAATTVVNDGGWQEVQQLTHQATGADIEVFVSVGFLRMGGVERLAKVGIFRNGDSGNPLFQTQDFTSGEAGIVSFAFKDTPAAGTYTYRLKIYPGARLNPRGSLNNISVADRFLRTLETKK